jgi:hypothetical protein
LQQTQHEKAASGAADFVAQKTLTKIIDWLREDTLKRRMREAPLGTKPSKSSKD